MIGRDARLVGMMAANGAAGLAMYVAGAMPGFQSWIVVPTIVMMAIGSHAGLAPRGGKSQAAEVPDTA